MNIAIPNDLVNDERLDFEQLGALVYLTAITPPSTAEKCADALMDRFWPMRWRAGRCVARLQECGYLGGAE